MTLLERRGRFCNLRAAKTSAREAHDECDHGACPKPTFHLTTNDSKHSRLRHLKNGVPQGLVLAPLLFNIYTYDLPSIIFRKFAYANDLALLHSSGNWKDLEGTLSQDIYTFSLSPDLKVEVQSH